MAVSGARCFTDSHDARIIPLMVLTKRLMVIGDHCGKTFAVRAYVKDEVPNPPYIAFCEQFWTDALVDGRLVEVEIFDFIGDRDRVYVIEDFFKVRVDSVVIFFSVHSRPSFEDVEGFWVPLVRGKSQAPIVVAGNLYGKAQQGPAVTLEEGERLAERVGAVCYLECWPDRKYNVERVFEEAVAASLKRSPCA